MVIYSSGSGILKRIAKKLAQHTTLDEESFKCRKCGGQVFKDRGNDVDCDKCGQMYNSSGQMISHPYGRGEDYAGEKYEED